MKFTTYTFNFKGGKITVRALNENQARILAQAEAINRCWNYEIIDHPTEKGGEEVMAEYECICKYCAFADACPSAYFPANKMKCADLRDMRRSANNTRTPKERGGEK